MNGAEIARCAREQLAALTGLPVDTVSGLARVNGEWRVAVDILEMKRIPDTGDVLAVYECVLDEDGNLMSYKRMRRYHRGQVGGEDA